MTESRFPGEGMRDLFFLFAENFKTMKNLFFTAVCTAALAITGCEILNPSSRTGFTPSLHGGNAYVNGDNYLVCGPGVYVTAISYKGDYDWRKDDEYGRVKGSVKVFSGDEMILELPAGIGTEISLDADKHHFIDGHLYTTFASDSETVIKKDGNEFIRYKGAEDIKGMIIKDGDFYSLGQKTVGTGGFSLRKNGDPLLIRDSGTIWGSFSDPAYAENGALYEDNGILYYSFYTSYREGASTQERHWFLGKNQSISEIWLEGYIKNLYDMRVINGELYRIASIADCPIVVFCEDFPYRFTNEELLLNHMDYYRLFPLGSSPYFFCSFRGKFNAKRTAWCSLWDVYKSVDGEVVGIYRDGNRYAAILKGGFISNDAILWTSSDISEEYFDDNYEFQSAKCGAYANGGIYVALNPKSEEDDPILWSHIGTLKYKGLNGILTGVKVLK